MIASLLALVLESSAVEDARRASVPVELSVDLGVVLSDTRRRPTGINVDFLVDDDRNPLLSPRRRDLVEALRELAPGYLRYPGGWKSAINLWSTPPYTSSRPVPAGRLPDEWIPPRRDLVSPDGSWRLDPLDFDEFMETCRAVAAQPVLVMAYESAYWPPSRGWTPPSRERLIETAVAWVRHARARGHEVRYWEIGNESWLDNETWTNRIPPQTYAADLVEFSRRMKAEDARIRVGANGDTEAWWQVVLGKAAEHVDFLSVHTYPCWKWANYEQYRTSSPDALASVRAATRALARHAPAHADRIEIMVTEFAAGTFGAWDETPADLGRALMTFDLQGQLLESREVVASQFWNTHNVYTAVEGGVFDALMRDNTLSPIGRALWIWNRYLGDEMVAATSSEDVRSFASLGRGGELVLFLVNKDTSARDASVALKRLARPLGRSEGWALRGRGPSDRRPVWAQAGPLEVSSSRVVARLDPVSITVIVLEPRLPENASSRPAP